MTEPGRTPRDADPSALYGDERRAFVAYLHTLTPTDLTTTVPATPAWTVHDVLAHLVAIPADLNAQRFDIVDADTWTAAQVETRRRHSIDELGSEWDREGPPFEAGLRLFGYQFGAHYLGDLLQHTADVHSTLGRAPERNDLAIAVGLDFYLASFDETLAEVAVGAVDVEVGDEHRRLGPGPVVAALRASRYELFRALGGRRTLDEIRAMAWTGDPEAVLALVSRYPVPLATLEEPKSATSAADSCL